MQSKITLHFHTSQSHFLTWLFGFISCAEFFRTSVFLYFYLQMSLDFENLDALITSGAIHAHVPAADIRMLSMVCLDSRANPKSVIFRVL